MHEAKTYRLIIIQNASLHWKTWGQEDGRRMEHIWLNLRMSSGVQVYPKSYLNFNTFCLNGGANVNGKLLDYEFIKEG